MILRFIRLTGTIGGISIMLFAMITIGATASWADRPEDGTGARGRLHIAEVHVGVGCRGGEVISSTESSNRVPLTIIGENLMNEDYVTVSIGAPGVGERDVYIEYDTQATDGKSLVGTVSCSGLYHGSYRVIVTTGPRNRQRDVFEMNCVSCPERPEPCPCWTPEQLLSFLYNVSETGHEYMTEEARCEERLTEFGRTLNLMYMYDDVTEGTAWMDVTTIFGEPGNPDTYECTGEATLHPPPIDDRFSKRNLPLTPNQHRQCWDDIMNVVDARGLEWSGDCLED